MNLRNRSASISSTILLLASLIFTAGGCSTVSHNAQFQPNFVSPANAGIELGPVTSQVENTGNVNPSKRLADALSKELGSAGLLLPAGTKGDHLILTTTILEYEEGYWFWKGALPGSTTVLSVHGDVKDSTSGAVVGSVDARRTIGFFHPFAFGSWARIFAPVARDMVEELKPRIEKR